MNTAPAQTLPRRTGSALLIVGAIALLTGTLLHPSSADPNQPALAFAEYAEDQLWIVSHLVQFFGVCVIFLGLIALAQRLKAIDQNIWIIFAQVLAATCIAVATALQAVDGIALKAMVDTWTKTDGAARDSLFAATLAVRQIEISLASMFSLVGGTTTVVFAIALRDGRHFPRWTSILGLMGGSATIAAGLIMARAGFSPLQMMVGMPAAILLLAWTIILGVFGWRGRLF